MYIGIIILVIVIGILFFWVPLKPSAEEKEKMRQEHEDKKERERKREKERREKFEKDFPDAAYIEAPFRGKVVAYSAKNRLIQFNPSRLRNTHTYQYDEIIGVDVVDEENVSTHTTTNPCSRLGRTALGYAVGGVAGAIVGGCTAETTTTTTVRHQYKVVIYTSRQYPPAETIHFDSDLEGANRTALMINKIIQKPHRRTRH